MSHSIRRHQMDFVSSLRTPVSSCPVESVIIWFKQSCSFRRIEIHMQIGSFLPGKQLGLLQAPFTLLLFPQVHNTKLFRERQRLIENKVRFRLLAAFIVLNVLKGKYRIECLQAVSRALVSSFQNFTSTCREVFSPRLKLELWPFICLHLRGRVQ